MSFRESQLICLEFGCVICIVDVVGVVIVVFFGKENLFHLHIHNWLFVSHHGFSRRIFPSVVTRISFHGIFFIRTGLLHLMF